MNAMPTLEGWLHATVRDADTGRQGSVAFRPSEALQLCKTHGIDMEHYRLLCRLVFADLPAGTRNVSKAVREGVARGLAEGRFTPQAVADAMQLDRILSAAGGRVDLLEEALRRLKN